MVLVSQYEENSVDTDRILRSQPDLGERPPLGGEELRGMTARAYPGDDLRPAHKKQHARKKIVDVLASTAARANASGGTRVASPKAAHMATTAYGVQAHRKPMHTATDSCGEETHAKT
ncbi:hypothetical protein EYF80_016434 [Liparis tanakae]|uniref:Uncharacterized protein n=1 Tax=Liparis tanakae TaxID=230148 RepID=A0A4Z2I687_9TELE|nr:hypothetical protein EYF80_016434 [Liparis tanakae]